jgi:hypothetical protein
MAWFSKNQMAQLLSAIGDLLDSYFTTLFEFALWTQTHDLKGEI